MADTRLPSRRLARGYALLALYHADHAERSMDEAFPALFSMLEDEAQWLKDAEGLHASGVLDEAPDSELRDHDMVGENTPNEGQKAFAQLLVQGVVDNLAEIDALIEEASTNWRVRRMPVVDRNILRLATFELMKCDDIPANVSVNEAIELAKRFGGDDSRAFVNGLVDRIGHKLGRLQRGGRRRRKG